jgi:hypothetical protein
MKTNQRTKAASPQPFQKTLTSVGQNVRVGDWAVTQRDLKLPGAGAWSVRQRVLHGGQQEGVELIEVDNGRMTLVLIPTRGMGVLKAQVGGVRLGWDSPVSEVVHPRHVNLTALGGLGWLTGFNEWLVRCGLECMGAPGPDKFTNAAGGTSEINLTLHGQIANIPASEVEVIIERTPPYRIRVRGRVDECRLFGPRLELWTELSTELGSATFQLEDTVTNRGGCAQEFQLLYHINYGPPLLEAGASFAAPIASLQPVTAHAAADLKRWERFGPPSPGLPERVYCMKPLADEQGQTTLLLHNAAADRAAALRFGVEQLPCVTLWKNTAALEDGYVTGLEPGTGFPLGRQRERAAGRVPKLAPGESRRFRLTHSLHEGKTEVAAALAGIQRIQPQKKPRLDKTPMV